jgi:hypothetical protein
MRTTSRTAHTSATIIFFGVITGYCNNGECPAREGEIHVKELVRPITAELRCPACRRPLALHSVQTREERHVADETAARLSVIDQLYERTHPGEATPLGAPGVRNEDEAGASRLAL